MLSEDIAIPEPEEESTEDNAVAATVPNEESSTPQIEEGVAGSEAAPEDISSDTSDAIENRSSDDDFSDILEIMVEDPELPEIKDMLRK